MIDIFTSHMSLFGALLGIDLIELVKWAGVVGVTTMVFAESGLLIGAFLPGDSLLFTAGFLTFTGFLPININVLVIILFLAAVLGDSTGYTFGRRVGRRLFSRPDSRLFKQAYVERAEKFYAQYGGKTIIMARFIPFVRTFAPVIAGTAKMSYKTFITFNIIGGALWAAGVTYLGYFLGTWFQALGLDIDQVILPAAIVIIFISILPPILHVLKDKEQRSAIWSGTKLQMRKLFKK